MIILRVDAAAVIDHDRAARVVAVFGDDYDAVIGGAHRSAYCGAIIGAAVVAFKLAVEGASIAECRSYFGV